MSFLDNKWPSQWFEHLNSVCVKNNTFLKDSEMIKLDIYSLSSTSFSKVAV